MDPTLLVLLSTSAAAGAAVLGPLPLVRRGEVPVVAVGWANALAAGLMLGPAYLLMSAGIQFNPLEGATGALLGIGFVWLTHHAGGTLDLELDRRGESSAVYKVIVTNAFHSASEGVAIGSAMALDLSFGLVMAGAIAVHNIPEATILASTLSSRGVPVGSSAQVSVVTNVPQILLAVVTFSVLQAVPAGLTWAIGFSFGSLVYLVLSELLPECYRRAGPQTVALVAMVAMGIVVLLSELVG